MKQITAGESHGKALVAIIEGLPAHLHIDEAKINQDLAYRQRGFGRGARQKIETDKVEILSGVRNRETLGSPVALCIWNKDFANWENCMSAGACDADAMQTKRLTAVRPGHADLTGVLKFEQSDARNVLERASARETAIRVAVGGVYKQYLSALGIQIGGYVKSVCDVNDDTVYEFKDLKRAKETSLGMLNEDVERQAMEKIQRLRLNGDTAGGVAEIRVHGLKSGFGSCMSSDKKLDARLAGALMGIQAVKGVEIGMGFAAATHSGKDVHDEILYSADTGYARSTNRAGGIEGGMSNGEEIIVRVAMKPIPTLMQGLKTVDVAMKEQTVAASERSDVCAIFALEIIAEAVVAQVLAEAVDERLGGDTMRQVQERYDALR